MSDSGGQAKTIDSAAKVNWAKWLMLIASFFVLGAVVAYLLSVEDTADVEQQKEEPIAQLVSIETIKPTQQVVEVVAFAEVRPRWSAEIRSAVSGRVTDVSGNAMTGERVEQGDMLVSIEKIQYLAQLAESNLLVKQRQLDLRLAKSATAIARKQFKGNGANAPNDLALHLPELEIAKAALKVAEAQLLVAKEQLSNTKVVAPFSGYITKRFVSPGQTVTLGESLLKIVDDTAFDLTAEIGEKDWLLLKKPLAGVKARIVNSNGVEVAQAKIRQGGGFLDETTRQYKIFLELVNTAESQVLSGDFIKLLIKGIQVDNALAVSESSLTQNGFIWYVDEKDLLQRFEPDILFRHQGRIILRAPEVKNAWRIALTPLAGFLPSQQVTAKEREQ